MIKFLLVDDIEANLLALEALLRRPGLELLKAGSGTAALEALLVHEIALALVDVHMPGMDGFELARLMRGTERTREVPIIFVTAGAADQQRRFAGYELGAVDFIFKPIEPHVLQSKSNVFFELARQRQVIRESEQRTQEANAQLETVLNHVPAGVALIRGSDLRLQFVNPAYRNLAPGREMLGKTVREACPKSDATLESVCRKVLETGEPHHVVDERFTLQRSPGQPPEPAFHSWSLHRVKLPCDKGWGLLKTTWETTERKKVETQLAASLEELRLAQDELIRKQRLATLGQLAGSVAHELRTPHSVIMNGIVFLEHSIPAGDETTREVLGEMRRAIGTSNSVIAEMLDYVRDPVSEQSCFPVAQAISRALHLVELPDTIQVDASTRNADELEVLASQDQVIRVLVNLIQNAVQAMPTGGRLQLGATPDGEGKVIITVRDTGSGIAPENLGRIFEPLFSTKVRGIGLGLAIAQRYANLNGGSLAVESEPGSGTAFHLTLQAR